ncbi:hypothetical protein ACFL3G_03980 [Planctomycetota bacterium]
MDEIAMAKGPVFDVGYVPYFYQAGKFLAYGMPDKTGLTGLSDQGSAGYDFTSDLIPEKGHFRHQNTVEDIVRNGYFPISKSEPETAIISDKKQTSGLGLSDIISQVRKRYQIYESNIYQIEMGKCYALNSVFYVEAMRGGLPQNSREAYSISKSLRELYEQGRDERVRLWQDVSKLKQALPEQAQQYLTAYRKVSILEDDSIGDPL